MIIHITLGILRPVILHQAPIKIVIRKKKLYLYFLL